MMNDDDLFELKQYFLSQPPIKKTFHRKLKSFSEGRVPIVQPLPINARVKLSEGYNQFSRSDVQNKMAIHNAFSPDVLKDTVLSRLAIHYGWYQFIDSFFPELPAPDDRRILISKPDDLMELLIDWKSSDFWNESSFSSNITSLSDVTLYEVGRIRKLLALDS